MDFVDSRIEDYSRNISTQPSVIAADLAEYTRKNIAHSQMLIGPLEASVLGFLIRAGNYKRVLEIGTYTGYSALCMAEQLPADGELVTLDVNKETTDIAREYWNKSPHGSKIQLILGDARETFRSLKPSFDLVFIDADKEAYPFYFEKALELLSPSGSIVIDNMLWSGRVLDEKTEGSTKVIQELNKSVSARAQKDLYVSLLTVRDGMLLIQKRK